MPNEANSRREYITVEAVGPTSGGVCDVVISYDRIQAVGRRSMGHAMECAHLVPTVLQRPTAIFEGLRREKDEDRGVGGWRCYCGMPGRAYRRDGTERIPWPGQVYVVFVNHEHVAYNWRWERCDPDNQDLPEHWQDRFRRRLL